MWKQGYYNRYFRKPSFVPVLHFVGLVAVSGYYFKWAGHMSHHQRRKYH
jgi:hypothetical protein